ncbi:hypothetical protein [Lactococcus formosensis]|uniref:hypothetical protein n=1 Tax=Lactococcus formosensis TaxID=1281486 RepID=UPI00254A274D|nr:hypothetical protein [Lactococcus formosensis]
MEIINLGLGVRQNNKGKTNLFSISKNEKASKAIEKEILDSYSELDFQSIEEFEPKSLIEETEYFVRLDELSDEDVLNDTKTLFLQENLLDEVDMLKLDKNRLSNLKSNKESVKFFIVELEDEYLLLAVNSRATIKGRNFLNLSIGSANNAVAIDYGVHIPTEITAVIEKSSHILYVMNVIAFESMLGLKYAKKAQATQSLNSFLNGEWTVGKEKYKITFEEYDKIESGPMKKARNINRLSSYRDGQADFEIERIKSAVDKLQEDQRVKFGNDEIIVNSKNFKTFTAILHNSIVLRLLSGDYNII